MKIMLLIQMQADALTNHQGFIWYHEFDNLNFYSIAGKEYVGPF